MINGISPNPLELTYGYDSGNTLTVTAMAPAGTDYTLSYQWYRCDNDSKANPVAIESGGDGASYTVSTGKAAGTTEYYYCAVTAKRTDNNATAATESAVATVTVGKAGATAATVVANNRTYDGTEKPLVTVMGQAIGGTMKYKLDNGTYSDELPKATDAGSYTVYYKLDGDVNYSDIAEAFVSVTVAPATVTLTANSDDTKTYNGNEQSVGGFISSVSGLTFNGVSAGGSGTNAGEYAVTFTGVTINQTKDTTGNYPSFYTSHSFCINPHISDPFLPP